MIVQVSGYGHTHVYHGDNEYCSLSAMQDGMKIFSLILDKYNRWCTYLFTVSL